MQLTFDDVESGGTDPDLRDVTFVVVDLETTGGSANNGDAITEIGAVKVRGGEILGEFATLVDPGRGIAPHITHLTGITTAMVTGAPRIDSVLPSFLEFAHGAVWVAHNARFDVGFLKAAAAQTGTPWPKPQTLCTVQLARRVLTRDEAPSVKLSEMARLFRADTTPNHRALDDARATVDVLHGLIGRVGNLGIHTLGELRGHLPSVTPAQRAKRVLADHLPERPSVYLFRGPGDEVLYVGTSNNLRRRVRNYFTSGETRGRIKEMVGLAERVDHVECAHALEAAARELRLIAAHTPPYNRRSKYLKRGWWICLTAEPFPRLAVRRSAAAGVPALGPVRSRSDASDIAELLADVCGVRTCTTKIRAGMRHECAVSPSGARPVGGCHASVAEPESAHQYRERAPRTRSRESRPRCSTISWHGWSRSSSGSSSNQPRACAIAPPSSSTRWSAVMGCWRSRPCPSSRSRIPTAAAAGSCPSCAMAGSRQPDSLPVGCHQCLSSSACAHPRKRCTYPHASTRPGPHSPRCPTPSSPPTTSSARVPRKRHCCAVGRCVPARGSLTYTANGPSPRTAPAPGRSGQRERALQAATRGQQRHNRAGTPRNTVRTARTPRDKRNRKAQP